MNKYKHSILFLLFPFLFGCGGGGGSGSTPPPRPSRIQKITFYDRKANAAQQDWVSSDWKSGVFDLKPFLNGSNLPTTPTTTSDPSENERVWVALNNNRLIIQPSPSKKVFNVLSLDNNSTLDIGSELNLEQLIINSGTVNDLGNQITTSSGSLGNGCMLNGDLNLGEFSGNPIYPATKTFKMTGGTITGNADIPSGFTLSGYGNINQSLINKGTLSLTSEHTLQVGGDVVQGHNGTLSITLTKKNSIPLLNALSSDIFMEGKLFVTNTTGADIPAGTKYILLSTSGNIDISGLIIPTNFKVERDPTNPNNYTLSILKSLSLSNRISRFLSQVRHASLPNLYLSSLQNNANFIQDMRTGTSGNLSFVGGKDVYRDSTFFAVNQKKDSTHIGMYAEYGEDAYDLGIYTIHSFKNIQLAHSLRGGKDSFSELTTHFMIAKTELMHTFEVSGVQITPKLIIGFEKFLLEENIIETFSRGFGIDVSSKMEIKTVPVEVFTSFNWLENEISEASYSLQMGIKLRA